MVIKISLRTQVKDALIEGIINGKYQPGKRLTEKELISDFGVSAAPIREALRELEVIGLMSSEPNKGLTVSTITKEELKEVYPVREALEKTAIRLATLNIEEFCIELEDIVERGLIAAEEENCLAFVMNSLEFHKTIVRASKNKILQNVWNTLGIESRTLITFNNENADQRRAAIEHQEIFKAMKAGNVKEAQTLISQHISKCGDF